jgi:FHS family L-fucose permease-like MFS transporter
MGFVSDRTGSMVNAMAVPACCFLVVLAFALKVRKAA